MDKKVRLFQVMEWHRGEFIPLKVTNAQGEKGKGKTVRITQETADQMNLDFNEDYRKGVQIKYVLMEEKGSDPKKDAMPIKEMDAGLQDLREKYKKVIGKNAFWKWNAEELTKKINEHK